MENASKALRIAAGVLIAILVVSLITFGYRRISESKKVEEEATSNKQLSEFNKKFESYNKRAIRGNDLVSLGNLVYSTNRNLAEDSEFIWYYKPMNYKYKNSSFMPIRVFFIPVKDNNETAKYNSNNNYDNLNFDNIDISCEIFYPNDPTKDEIPGIKNINATSKDAFPLPHKISEVSTNLKSSSKIDLSGNTLMIDLGEYCAKIFNNNDTDKSSKKIFKNQYFSCIGIDYDSSNGRVCKMYFEQVHRVN